MSTRRRIRTWLEGIDWLKVVLSIGFLLTAADIVVASVALIRQRPINTLEAVLTVSIAVLISVAAVIAWSRSSAERRRRREEERLDAIRRHLDLLDEVKAVRRLLEGGSVTVNRKQNPRNRPKRKPDGDPGSEKAADESAGKVRP
jgi:adenylate kinase